MIPPRREPITRREPQRECERAGAGEQREDREAPRDHEWRIDGGKLLVKTQRLPTPGGGAP